MELKDWCNAVRGRSSRLAKATDIPPSFLSQMVAGNRPVPPAAAVAIERETDGAVTRADLRPDDYWLIWPDLKAPKRKEGE